MMILRGGQVLSREPHRCGNMQYCVQNDDELTCDNKGFISSLQVRLCPCEVSERSRTSEDSGECSSDDVNISQDFTVVDDSTAASNCRQVSGIVTNRYTSVLIG